MMPAEASAAFAEPSCSDKGGFGQG